MRPMRSSCLYSIWVGGQAFNAATLRQTHLACEIGLWLMAARCSHMQVKLAQRDCESTPDTDAGFVESLNAFASSAAEPKRRVDVLADGLLLGYTSPLEHAAYQQT